MVRLITALSVVALVAACGGSRYSSNNAAGARSIPRLASAQFASGPIATACQSAGRKQASRSRCGCVQAVANRSLSRTEQIRGASFFKDPQKAQDTRQSDNAANERFWKKWKAYGADAASLCK
jgi:hypothetical protein